ncbi:MAG: hypothetical protein MRK01_02160 [Candidatus Scalindua sp.]|nr:hypothetical protein [Candidatus Scalindua sp.]
MNPFKLKRKLKKISLLAAIPYIILCITSGGLHSFDKGVYHAHTPDGPGSKKEKTEIHEHRKLAAENKPALCCNDHSSDKCGICRWLKSTPAKVQFEQQRSSFFQVCSNLFIIDHTSYNSLKIYTNSPRSPPFLIA